MKIGDKVHYVPSHADEKVDFGEMENGIIKSFAPSGNPFVVYNCGGEWNRIEDYTAANTPYDTLKLGWIQGARNHNLSIGLNKNF